MTETQQAYVEWRANPEREGTKKAWAQEHEIALQTLYNWEHTEWFQSAMEDAMRAVYLSMDKIMEVVKGMQEKAAKGDTQAAKLYLAFLERVQPMKVGSTGADLPSMTDEQLETMLAGAID